LSNSLSLVSAGSGSGVAWSGLAGRLTGEGLGRDRRVHPLDMRREAVGEGCWRLLLLLLLWPLK